MKVNPIKEEKMAAKIARFRRGNIPHTELALMRDHHRKGMLLPVIASMFPSKNGLLWSTEVIKRWVNKAPPTPRAAQKERTFRINPKAAYGDVQEFLSAWVPNILIEV